MPLSEGAAVEASAGEVTQLLREAANGSEAAQNELFRLVFPRLRRLAANKIRQERPGYSLSARTLVHEAWKRLANQQTAPENSAQFFGVFALTMKRILLDHAKRKISEKHGGGWQRVPLDESLILPQKQAEELLDIERCLEKLAEENPRQAKVVDLRFYAGLSNVEIAEEMGISLSTVEADWRFARAWLRLELEGAGYEHESHAQGAGPGAV
jgi:RNA polymerase sigma factor (TIGR02999 family)